MNIICFLTVRPSLFFYKFCKLLQKDTYKVFICIDDNSYKIPEYDGVIPLIYIDRKVPESAGYKSTVLSFTNKACSRDKALYFFNRVYNDSYSYLWMIEEDVLVPHVDTIANIDLKYPTGDLLSASHGIVRSVSSNWHWPHINRQIRIPPPYACSMICAIRTSVALMRKIDEYAETANNLFMDEALFNTIALQSDLEVITPSELSTIHYNTKWTMNDFTLTNLFHPVKVIEEQYAIRDRLSAHDTSKR